MNPVLAVDKENQQVLQKRSRKERRVDEMKLVDPFHKLNDDMEEGKVGRKLESK